MFLVFYFTFSYILFFILTDVNMQLILMIILGIFTTIFFMCKDDKNQDV
jgi:hypothetical protein